MARRVKDFIEVGDYTSLDRLITTLQAIRDTLPHDSEPELKLRGDDVFGRRISICYMRELTDEEADCDDRYAEVIRAAQEQALTKLQEELGVVCRLHTPRKRRAA